MLFKWLQRFLKLRFLEDVVAYFQHEDKPQNISKLLRPLMSSNLCVYTLYVAILAPQTYTYVYV